MTRNPTDGTRYPHHSNLVAVRITIVPSSRRAHSLSKRTTTTTTITATATTAVLDMSSFDGGRAPPQRGGSQSRMVTEYQGQQHESRLANQPQRQLMPHPMHYHQPPQQEFHYYPPPPPPPESHHSGHNPDYFHGPQDVPAETVGWMTQHPCYSGPMERRSEWQDRSTWEVHQTATGSGYHDAPDPMWPSNIRAGQPALAFRVSGEATNYTDRNVQPLHASSSTMQYSTQPSYQVFVPVSHTAAPLTGTNGAAWQVNDTHSHTLNEFHSRGYDSYQSLGNQEFVQPTKPCAREVSGDDEVVQHGQVYSTTRVSEQCPTVLRVEPLMGTDEKPSVYDDQRPSPKEDFRTMHHVVHSASFEQEPQRINPGFFLSQSNAVVQLTQAPQDSRDEEPTIRLGRIAEEERVTEGECAADALPPPEAILSSKAYVQEILQHQKKASATIGEKCPKKVPSKKKTYPKKPTAKKKVKNEDDHDIDELTPMGRHRRGYPGWRKNYEKLLDFYKENGHCVVPRGYLLDPQVS
jgi:hypothetical protein